jgi:AcrR family transcriptional regulator
VYNRIMMKTNTKKTKRVRRDRKEEILEKATRLFGEYGFQGTTLSRIAEEVGLTEQGVLHYFPSKVHLLQGVLEYREQKEIDKYSKLIEAEKDNAAEIFKLLEDLQAENEEVPGLIQLFTVLVGESIRSDHPSHDYFVGRYRRGREVYANQFLKLSKIKIRPDIDLDELASLIMAVMDGLQIQWLLDPGKVDMVAAFKLFSKIVVAYLEK